MSKTKRPKIMAKLESINYAAVGDLPKEDNSFYLVFAPLFEDLDGLKPQQQVEKLRAKVVSHVSDNESAFAKVTGFPCLFFLREFFFHFISSL